MNRLKYFNFITVMTLILSVIIPSITVLAITDIDSNQKNVFENDTIKVVAEQVSDDSGNPLKEKEIAYLYTVTNKKEQPVTSVSIAQLNNEGIEFDLTSFKINGELVTDRTLSKGTEEIEGTPLPKSTTLTIKDLKPKEASKLFIKAKVADSFNSEKIQKIEILENLIKIGDLNFSINIPTKQEAPIDAKEGSSEISVTEEENTNNSENSSNSTVEEQTNSKIVNPVVDQLMRSQNLAAIAPSPGRGFEQPIYQDVHKGELYSTGNTNFTVSTKSAAATNFLNNRGPSSPNTVANFSQSTVDIDNDPATSNSSKAYIDLAGAKEIAWAGLFWSSSRVKGTPTATTNMSDAEITAPVVFKTPGGTSSTVPPDTYYRIDQTDGKNPGQGFGKNNTGYSNYADVTSILQKDGSNTGSYIVGNIPMTNAFENQNQLSNFSGWSLFVVTKDQAKKSRAFSIYYGAKGNAANANNEFVMSDFLTAKKGRLDPIVTWFTVQGDKFWTGDNGQIKKGNVWTNIVNQLNPANNVMNGTVSDQDQHMVDKYPGTFNPSFPNFIGIDVDRINLPEGLLTNGQSNISFKTTSSGDDFSTNAIGFSVNAEVPDLQISKEIVNPKTTYAIGDEVVYRVKIKNITENTESIKTISEDILDSRLDYTPNSLSIISGPNMGNKTDQSGDDQAEYDSDSKKIVVRVGENANAINGGSYKDTTDETVYEFKAKINSTALPNQKIPNKANVKGTDVLTNVSLDADSEVVEVQVESENIGKMETAKTVNNPSPKIGDELEYSITFKNTIPNSVLNKVTVTDTLPKGLTYVEGSVISTGSDPQPTSLSVMKGKLVAEYPTIRDTEERKITFKVKVNSEAVAGTPIVNQAIIDDHTNPPDEPKVPVTPTETPGELIATKSVNNQSPKIGEEVEYRISFSNKIENGVLNQVTVTDSLPKGLTYVEGSLKSEGEDPQPTSLKVTDNKVVAEYKNIKDTKTRSLVFKVKVNSEAVAGTPIVNQAIIDDHTNPPDEPKVPVTPTETPGELIATKSVNNQSPKIGEEVEYRISFSNKIENGVLNQVTVTDSLPKGLTYVEGSLKSEGEDPQPTSLKVTDNKVVAEYKNIKDTKTRSLVFKVKVNSEAVAGTPIVNQAVIDDHTNPPDRPEVPIVPEKPDKPRETNVGKIITEKLVDNKTPKIGEIITYRITMKNSIQDSTVKEVSIKDQLPVGLTFIEGSLISETDHLSNVKLEYKNGTISAFYPEIADTKVHVIQFKTRVNKDAENKKTITNIANIKDESKKPQSPSAEIKPQNKWYDGLFPQTGENNTIIFSFIGSLISIVGVSMVVTIRKKISILKDFN
ncbi:isopeptide-forming domain-containing fimbrial protein [Carnobacterium divergens]|uniref:isopeptide-forming domain-containing fimbrial protein n=1 Tax=Carnobacterium divergens TaxID=2748 RepID=UPI001431B2BB|nr:isopeptide-forming domain-containing fimbrial protein [Carnobacterium divergens]